MKAMFKKMDKTLLFLMFAFTIFGLVMIWSASSITAVLAFNLPQNHFFINQLIAIIIGWIGGMIILNIKTSTYKFLAPIGMLVAVGALALLIPYGTIINQSRRWFDLGFFAIQPSEFAKPLIIVFLAVYFQRLIKSKNINLNNVIIPFFFVLVAAFLTAIQPDFGTAAIIAGIGFGIFMALPIDTKQIKWLKKIGVITTAVVAVFILSGGGGILNLHQMQRLTFREPCTRYTEPTGYQVCNGLIAIANGGIFGVGLGNSTQKYLYLPEAHTDFIFPIIIEELGVVAAAIIIILFIVLLYRVLKISTNAPTLKGSIIAYGVFLMLLAHLLVNFLGVLALIPLTGVSVPFLSYGGSFYLVTIGSLFLVQRIHIESVEARTSKVLN